MGNRNKALVLNATCCLNWRGPWTIQRALMDEIIKMIFHVFSKKAISRIQPQGRNRDVGTIVMRASFPSPSLPVGFLPFVTANL